MDIAACAVIVAIMVPLTGALIAIFTRLGKISAAVEALSEQVDRDGAERLRLWKKIDEHADRLTRLEVKQEVIG